MSVIKPRFIVIDDMRGEASRVISAIKEYDPEADVKIESSHPFFFEKLIEANREAGGLFAIPQPTIVLLDGDMAADYTELTSWENENLFPGGKSEFYQKTDEWEVSKWDNSKGARKILDKFKNEIGPFISPLVSGKVTEPNRYPDDWDKNPQALSSLNCPISFNKKEFSAIDVKHLVKYLGELTTL